MNKRKQLHELAQDVSLSLQEKSGMKARLLQEMRNQSTSPFSYTSLFVYMRSHAALTAFICILFFSTTTTALADKAMPGDVLYGIKTKINEPILGALATTQYEKKEWQVTLASRRLDEAEKIANRDDISDDVKMNHTKILDEQILVAELGVNEYVVTENIEVTTTLAVESDVPQSNDTFAMKSASMMSTFAEPVPDNVGLTSIMESSELVSIREKVQEEIRKIDEEIKQAQNNNLSREKILQLRAKQIKLRSELLKEYKESQEKREGDVEKKSESNEPIRAIIDVEVKENDIQKNDDSEEQKDDVPTDAVPEEVPQNDLKEIQNVIEETIPKSLIR